MNINESRLKAVTERTEIIKNLSEGFFSCFDGDDKYVKVKNLQYDELQKVIEEVAVAEQLKSKSMDELKAVDSKSYVLEAIISVFETVKESYGNLSSETIRRISLLKYGSIEPKISHTNAVLIAKHFSIDFKAITDRILILSQMGGVSLGESEESTKGAEGG